MIIIKVPFCNTCLHLTGAGPRSRASSIQSAPEMSRGLASVEHLNNSPSMTGAANASISVSVAPIMIAHSGSTQQHHGSHSKLYTSQERLQQQPQSLQVQQSSLVVQLPSQQQQTILQPQQSLPLTPQHQQQQQAQQPQQPMSIQPHHFTQPQTQQQQPHQQSALQQQLLQQSHQVVASQPQPKQLSLNNDSLSHSIANGELFFLFGLVLIIQRFPL